MIEMLNIDEVESAFVFQTDLIQWQTMIANLMNETGTQRINLS
jgi:hypothetical protein